MKKPWQTGFVWVVVTLDEARRLKASLSRHFDLPFRLWHVLVPTKINGLGDILISSRTRPSLTLWIETKNFGIASLCFNRQPSKVAHLHPVAIRNAAPCRQVHLNESSERIVGCERINSGITNGGGNQQFVIFQRNLIDLYRWKFWGI